MGWATPEFSPSDVDAAGRILAEEPEDDYAWTEELENYEWALRVINNWRSSHAFPLNTFQMNLRTKTKTLEKTAIVAQRVKRLPAIEHKLGRRPDLTLSRMQDIGGCRGVVSTVRKVRSLCRLFLDSHIKHELARHDDYISTPRHTGYRGIHLIYRYRGSKSSAYDNLKIEVQLRTKRQHAWATAVETVGVFRQEMLKANQGDDEWLRFFALMGTAIANRERCPSVPDTPASRSELADQLRAYADNLDVRGHLTAYHTALNVVRHPSLAGNHYFILRLDPVAKEVRVTGYRKGQLEQAQEDYQRAERRTFDQPGPDVVLVSVDRVNALQRAYPNYFLDTRLFLEELARAIS